MCIRDSYYAYSSYVFCSMDAAEGLIKGWGEDGEGISEAYYYVTDLSLIHIFSNRNSLPYNLVL